jgi:glyoxylase-like metal-dependent hydrolase (beta-lactamase superfamily II)
MQHVTLGSATVTICNAGDIRADLVAWFGQRVEDWPRYRDILERPLAVPMQCVHIALEDASVMVDAPHWSASIGQEFLLPDYPPPPGLPAQLRAAGIDPAAVTHVVITHLHFDHFNGLTLGPSPSMSEPVANEAPGAGSTSARREGERLAYPNARHFIGRADWDGVEVQKALRKEGSMTHRTLGQVHALGLLTRVDGDLPIADGITILAAPGETRGHHIVRVRSNGQTLYCVGDLIHHEVEFEQPGWHVRWADVDASRASRIRLVESALAEGALIVAAHVRGAGRLQPAAGGVNWNAAT